MDPIKGSLKYLIFFSDSSISTFVLSLLSKYLCICLSISLPGYSFLPKLKDRVPFELQSFVVYKFVCNLQKMALHGHSGAGVLGKVSL